MRSIIAAVTGLFLLQGSTGTPTSPVLESAVDTRTPAYETHTVLMTAYNAVPEQTDSDPHTTASGAFSDPDIVAARSRDLAGELPFGTVIEIVQKSEGVGATCGLPVVEKHLGYRVIADTMHARKRNQIDILFDHNDTVKVGEKQVNPAVAFGICKNVEIRVVGYVEIKNMPKSQAALRVAIGHLRTPEAQFLAIKK